MDANVMYQFGVLEGQLQALQSLIDLLLASLKGEEVSSNDPQENE